MTDIGLQFNIWQQLRSQGPHQTQIRSEKGTWGTLIDENVFHQLLNQPQGEDSLVRIQLSNYLYGHRYYE